MFCSLQKLELWELRWCLTLTDKIVFTYAFSRRVGCFIFLFLFFVASWSSSDYGFYLSTFLMLIAISSFSYIIEFLWCMLGVFNHVCFTSTFDVFFLYVLLVWLYLVTLIWNHTTALDKIWWLQGGLFVVWEAWSLTRLLVEFELLQVESIPEAHDCFIKTKYMLGCIWCVSTDFNLFLLIDLHAYRHSTYPKSDTFCGCLIVARVEDKKSLLMSNRSPYIGQWDC